MLEQVLLVHHKIRKDLFKEVGTKYTVEALKNIINNPISPIFVYVDDNDKIIAHAFCEFKEGKETSSTYKRSTFFIDDLVVHEAYRNKGIGSELYKYLKNYAKENGFYHIILHVWEGNNEAQKFYEKIGMKPVQTVMEEIL